MRAAAGQVGRFDVAPMKIDQGASFLRNSRTNTLAQANQAQLGMATRTDCSGPGGGRLNDDRWMCRVA
jgi:hypothetical protein